MVSLWLYCRLGDAHIVVYSLDIEHGEQLGILADVFCAFALTGQKVYLALQARRKPGQDLLFGQAVCSAHL